MQRIAAAKQKMADATLPRAATTDPCTADASALQVVYHPAIGYVDWQFDQACFANGDTGCPFTALRTLWRKNISGFGWTKVLYWCGNNVVDCGDSGWVAYGTDHVANFGPGSYKFTLEVDYGWCATFPGNYLGSKTIYFSL